MVLGFKEQFRQPIINGLKIHTIRKDRHGRWKSGKKIHFATGTRTKQYHQFYEDVCVSVQPIVLVNHGNFVYCRIQTGDNEYIHNDCMEHENTKRYRGALLDDLCKNDGLEWEDFKKWFVPNNDDKFVGKIIHWTSFRYEKGAVNNG